MKENHQNSTSETNQVSSSSQKTPFWCRCMFGVFSFCLLFLFTTVCLLGTGIGQRSLIQLANYWLDNLTIQQVSGSLQQGLHLQQLKYQSKGIKVEVANADLQLDFSCLLHLHLCVPNIKLQHPQIEIDTQALPPTTTSTKTTKTGHLWLPTVTLGQLTINQLNLSLDQQKLQLTHFSTAGNLSNTAGLILKPTLIEGLTFIQTPVIPATTPNPPSTKPIDWQQLKANLSRPLFSQDLHFQLPFAIEITQIIGKNWQYYPPHKISPLILTNLRLSANLRQDEIKALTLNLATPFAQLTAQGTAQFNHQQPFNLVINTKINQKVNQYLQTNQLSLPDQQRIPESEINLSAHGKLTEQTQIALKVMGLADLTLQAKANFSQETNPFQLQLDLKHARYPLQLHKKQNPHTDQLRLNNLNLHLSGNLLNYQLNLQGQVDGLYSPPTQIDLVGSGTPTSFTIKQAQLTALRGSLQLQGQINWENEISWYAKLQPHQLHLEDYPYTKNWYSTLSGMAEVNGVIRQKKLTLDVNQIDLTGNFNRKPLRLTGNLNLTPPQVILNTKGLDLHYGSNHIYLKGVLGKTSDFLAEIKAPNLAGLLPNLNATLQGTVKLKGQLLNPTLIANLQGNNLRFQQFSLQKFNLNSNISSQKDQIQGQLDLMAEKLNLGANLNFNQIQLQAKGNEQQHKLSLNAQGTPIAGNLNLNGSFNRTKQVWQGVLSQVSLTTPIGLFSNNKTIDLDYHNQSHHLMISAHCWQNNSLPLCFPKTINISKTGNIEFISQNANLKFLQKYLPSDTSLQGNFNLNGNLAWFEHQPLKADILLDSPILSLTQKLDYRTLKVNFNQINLTGKLANDNLSFQAGLNFNQQGKLNTSININNLSQQRTLNGQLAINQVSLNFLRPLLAKGEKIQGGFNGQLQFTGTLLSPKLYGSIGLSNFQASLQAMPFDIKNGQLDIRFDGTQSTLNGKIISKQNDQLNLTGETNWQPLQNWQSNLNINAQNFRIAIEPFATLTVSPNIDIQATAKLLKLTGDVDIPTGIITVNQLPESAVKVSSDEVILDANNQAPATEKSTHGIGLVANIHLNLGNNVTINAYGLKSHLNGVLNLKQEQQNLGLFGQVNLTQGQYTSFGQDLVINKGQISFSGLPSQPFLNIEAIRNPKAIEDNVVAGIKVTGLAESPQVDVFSIPAMSQDNALSYLLTGHSLSAANGNGNNIVGTALIGLGLAQSSKLVGKIGQTFGIQNLNIETQGGGDQSKVVVSGYITPRLQVKYGIGLFEPLAQLTLRYRLLPQLYIQSVSGTNQAVDLLYQFER